MAIKTYTEQLESVQATIQKIETQGQAYEIEGNTRRSLTRADLKTLYAREEYLRQRVEREQRGGRVKTQYVIPNG